MDDNSIIDFGKYKGQKLCNIPANYLIWLYEENKCFGGLKAYIKNNIDVLKSEIKCK
jgi:uncharacterized protein (DUF3820 family)